VVEAVRNEGMERLARNAARAGIGWIVQQQGLPYVATLRGEGFPVPIGAVAVDEAEIGRIQASQLQALLPRGGGVLLLQGPPDSSTTAARLSGLQEALKGSQVVLKGALHGGWTEPSAEAAVRSWLRLKSSESTSVDVVAAQNDSMALGARKAILDVRKEWARVPFTGCDGLPAGGQRLVDAGDLVATIVKPTTTGTSLELIAGALAGRPLPAESLLRPRSYPPLEKLGNGRPGPA
jgi:ribose transport system substrate-binding protein